MNAKEVLDFAAAHNAKVVDVRFTDLPGLWHHVSFPTHELDEKSFEDGFGMDGSSIRGWAAIHESDMLLVPDPAWTSPRGASQSGTVRSGTTGAGTSRPGTSRGPGPAPPRFAGAHLPRRGPDGGRARRGRSRMRVPSFIMPSSSGAGAWLLPAATLAGRP